MGLGAGQSQPRLPVAVGRHAPGAVGAHHFVTRLARAARRPLPEGYGPIRLDLSSVTFADEGGVRLLRELLRQGVQVAAASGFVTALLRLEDR